MDGRYTKEKGVHDKFDEEGFIEEPDLWKEEDNPSLFHIGSYCVLEDKKLKPKKMICIECGGDKFNVGSVEWYVVIRCVSCEWEEPIASG